MKTIYRIIIFIFLMQTVAYSQFEVLGVVRPTDENSCDGKINLKFVESELPYQLDFTSTSGQSGSFTVTSTVFTIPDLCPGTITINAVDNHGCDSNDDVELEECGEIDVSFEQVDEGCDFAGINIFATINEGDGLAFNWSNGQITKDLLDVEPSNYEVTIVDAFDCKKQYTFEIKRPFIKDYKYPTNKIIDDGYITVECTGVGAPYNLKLFDSKENELYNTNESEFTQGVFTFPIGLWYDTYKIVATNNNGCERILYQTFNDNNCNIKLKIVDILADKLIVNLTECSEKHFGEVEFEIIGGNNNAFQYDFNLYGCTKYKDREGIIDSVCSLVESGVGKTRFYGLKSVFYNYPLDKYKIEAIDIDNNNCVTSLFFEIQNCSSIIYSEKDDECIEKKYIKNKKSEFWLNCFDNIENNRKNGQIVYTFRDNPINMSFKLFDPDGNEVVNYIISSRSFNYRYNIYFNDLSIPGEYCLETKNQCGFEKTLCTTLEICFDSESCKNCKPYVHCFNGIKDGNEVDIDCGGDCIELTPYECYHCNYCNDDPDQYVGDGNYNPINSSSCMPLCDEDWHCINHNCYQICSDDNECPVGYECKNGYCQIVGSTECIPPCPDGQKCNNGYCQVALCNYSVIIDDGYTVDYEQYLSHDLKAGDEIEITKICKPNGLSVKFIQEDPASNEEQTLWVCPCEFDCSGQPNKFNLLYDNIPVLIKVFPKPISDFGSCSGYDKYFCVTLFCVDGQRDDDSVANKNKVGNSSQLSIFPNPFNSVINIISEKEKIKEVRVLNTIGQLVSNVSYDIPVLNTKIDMVSSVNGIYYVKVFLDNGEVITRKIIKTY